MRKVRRMSQYEWKISNFDGKNCIKKYSQIGNSLQWPLQYYSHIAVYDINIVVPSRLGKSFRSPTRAVAYTCAVCSKIKRKNREKSATRIRLHIWCVMASIYKLLWRNLPYARVLYRDRSRSNIILCIEKQFQLNGD